MSTHPIAPFHTNLVKINMNMNLISLTLPSELKEKKKNTPKHPPLFPIPSHFTNFFFSSSFCLLFSTLNRSPTHLFPLLSLLAVQPPFLLFHWLI